MAYVKNTWVDQEGQIRYRETQDGDYKIFTANYEQVTEIGTPVNADNMNHIEDGIAGLDTSKASVDLDNLSASGQAIIDNKVDKTNLQDVMCVVESYVNGTSRYCVWSDGRIEQWGVSGNNVTVTLLKPYTDANYTILSSVRNGTTWAGGGELVINTSNITNGSFYHTIRGYDSTAPNLSWYTCGY